MAMATVPAKAKAMATASGPIQTLFLACSRARATARD